MAASRAQCFAYMRKPGACHAHADLNTDGHFVLAVFASATVLIRPQGHTPYHTFVTVTLTAVIAKGLSCKNPSCCPVCPSLPLSTFAHTLIAAQLQAHTQQFKQSSRSQVLHTTTRSHLLQRPSNRCRMSVAWRVIAETVCMASEAARWS